jgi:hypothetical protein
MGWDLQLFDVAAIPNIFGKLLAKIMEGDLVLLIVNDEGEIEPSMARGRKRWLFHSTFFVGGVIATEAIMDACLRNRRLLDIFDAVAAILRGFGTYLLLESCSLLESFCCDGGSGRNYELRILFWPVRRNHSCDLIGGYLVATDCQRANLTSTYYS